MRLANKEILIASNGNQFTTLHEIDKIAAQESSHPFVLDSIKRYNLKNDLESLKKVHAAAFKIAKFFPDPDSHQYIRTLNRTLKDQRANCVDYTVFLSAFLRAMKVPHIIRMVSFDKKNPQAYSHIYPLTAKGLALDAVYGQEQTGLEALKDESERKPYFGKQVPFVNNFDKFIKA